MTFTVTEAATPPLMTFDYPYLITPFIFDKPTE